MDAKQITDIFVEAGWLTAEQATLPARWQDLRRAVYSRASIGAPMATPPGPEPAPSHPLHDRHP